MPLNPPRVLVLRAHALEIFISGAAITLGLFVWLSMKDSNSGVNLLAGAAPAGGRNYIVRFSDENYSEVLRTRDISVVYCAYRTNGIGVFRTVGVGHRSRWQAAAHE
jgi:hypothetical protein